MIISTSRLALLPCTCVLRREALVTSRQQLLHSSPLPRLRRNWFVDRDQKRRQVAEPFLDELLAGPSAFKGVDTKTTELDLDYVDKQTERPANQEDVEGQPWYVKAEYADLPGELSKDVGFAPEPLPSPPAHLPASLHPAYEELANSLWIDGYTTTWIDARNGSEDGNTYTDWIVIATVKPERERSMAGVLAPMKAIVRSPHFASTSRRDAKAQIRNMVRSLYPADYPSLDSPRQPGVRVEGYQRHHPDWILFDAGCVMLHVFSAKARDTWNIEEPWLKAARAKELDAQRDIHPFFSTQSRGPSSGTQGRGY